MQYLIENFNTVWDRAVEHMAISAISVAIALCVSLPLGVLLSRPPLRPLAGAVLSVLGVIYTIPSFALFALLVPVMEIGPRPAIFALVAYSLFVLVRNAFVAFTNLDPAVMEAARGMGMSPMQLLRRVELPLATPVLVAGLRVATLSTIGLASIAAWIGAGGLGQLLKDGINYPPRLYAGVIALGLMAVGADLLFRLLERRFTRYLHPSIKGIEAVQPKEA
jgi:osmoprotectant transport system permease protein